MNLPQFTGDEPCTTVGVDQFVGDGDVIRISQVRELRKVCSGCPMQEPCLEYALHVKVVGFWGGMTDRERDKERRARGIKARRALVAV